MALDEEIEAGEFERQEDAFRQWISARDETDYPAESGRYHLYVSLACPWAHRTLIVRRLLGLDNVVSASVLDPVRDSRGWRFGNGDGFSEDPVNGFSFLSEAYEATDSGWDGRITVPVLWDRKNKKIVNNSEDDICLMFAREFSDFIDPKIDLFPRPLEDAQKKISAFVYENINNGVYRAGFAGKQAVHAHWVKKVFDALDKVEDTLSQHRYLLGDRMTEADLRLFCTLVRFDAVYYVHFKCNIRRIIDYPNLWGFTRDIYQTQGISETVNIDHIKRHYYMTHPDLNPTRFVPVGPGDLNFDAPHGRG